MNIKSNTEKGYLTLEAAIFLPVFIIAILTLGYFIKIIGINETVCHIAMDEGDKLAAKAYAIKVAPEFPGQVEKRIAEANLSISNVKVEHFYYLYPDLNNTGLISFQVSGKATIRLPLDFPDGYGMVNRFKCRGFIGKNNKGKPMPFEEMEIDTDSNIVWIFPMSGKRYHSESCTYVVSYPVQMVLNQQIQRKYKPCHLCKPGELSPGNLVYCFLNSGEVYHKGTCKTIDKYTVEIEREEAIEKGYTPCSKCGGG